MSDYRFLVFAPQDGSRMSVELGRADYSYRFVLTYYQAMLESIGPVVELSRPDEPVTREGRTGTDVRLLFMPPHQIPVDMADRSIPVFAWEYTTVPTEPFGADARNDWREILGRAPAAITHSQFAATAVREAMGAHYPVASIPAPVWERFEALAHTQARRLSLTGAVVDSLDPNSVRLDGSVDVSGTVFTTVLNPYDGRKVWADTITAFVWALRDQPGATLVIKLVHHDRELVLSAVQDLMFRLAPYACRIVAVHGFLPASEYADLIAATDYVVNSSRGEGQCLPLMEFMSAGVPAVAPDHTAMAEYVNPTDAFVVASSREWSWWPHDPRRFLRCMRHPVDWNSLQHAFQAAFHASGTDLHRSMSQSAREALREYCSMPVTRSALLQLLQRADLPV